MTDQLSLLDLSLQPDLEAEPLPSAPIPDNSVQAIAPSPLEPLHHKPCTTPPQIPDGTRVIVDDPAGEWVGEVVNCGYVTVFVRANPSAPAIGYSRDQVHLLASPDAPTLERLELRAKDRAIREEQERRCPKHDCRECRHFKAYAPNPERLYECAIGVFSTPCSLRGIYGLHIGCNKFRPTKEL